MQASLFNMELFYSNTTDIPLHPPSNQEQISSQVELDMWALDMPNFSGCGRPLHFINTAFDHNHTFNKKLGFPPKNKRKCYCYTQKERADVEHAQKCVSLEDFQKQVSILLLFHMNSFKCLFTRSSLNYLLVPNPIVVNISN